MNKHRVLIIGVGSIGERHLRCFGLTDRADLSLCEINPELRNTIVRRYDIKTSFESVDEALLSEPDVAVVCVPAHLHVPIATNIAARGIHVLCEKPMGVSLDGVDELIETVNQHGITAAVAYVMRCYALYVAFKAVIDSGRFGKPVNLIHVSGQNFPFYRPAYRATYYADHGTGGGAIQDSITHYINLGEWFVGPVDKLAADAAHLMVKGVDVEDTVHVMTRQGDVLGCYSHNQHQMPNESTYTVMCEGGTLRAEFHNSRWMWQTRPDEPWHVEEIESLERDDHFVAQAHMFLDAVEDKGAVRCTLAEGCQTLRVNLAALNTAQQHTWQIIEH